MLRWHKKSWLVSQSLMFLPALLLIRVTIKLLPSNLQLWQFSSGERRHFWQDCLAVKMRRRYECLHLVVACQIVINLVNVLINCWLLLYQASSTRPAHLNIYCLDQRELNISRQLSALYVHVQLDDEAGTGPLLTVSQSDVGEDWRYLTRTRWIVLFAIFIAMNLHNTRNTEDIFFKLPTGPAWVRFHFNYELWGGGGGNHGLKLR